MTENVASLRSVKVATPPCAAKAAIPSGLAVRKQHKMLFAASKFESEYFNSVKEYKCMSKAILAAIVSLVLGVLAEASVGVRWNMTGIGCIVSVVIMGAFIIYFNDKKKYLMEYSCLKTLASKHKTSLSKIIDKFNDDTGKWGVPYETKLGIKRRYFANYADCKGKGSATDYISNAAIVYGYAVNTLENRLKAKVCELCGTTESDHYEVHHINKLKNLKGKERWEIAMIAKHRKTLVVCRDCHRSIIHKK